MTHDSVTDEESDPKLILVGQFSGSPSAAIICAVRNKLQQVRFHTLLCRRLPSKVQFMTERGSSSARRHSADIQLSGLLILMLLMAAPCPVAGQPTTAALKTFDTNISAVELRLAQQHRSQNEFVAIAALGPQGERRLRGGELIFEKLTPAAEEELPGAMLHQWRGTAFAAGETAADFERLMKDFNAYPQHYSPQVMQARVVTQEGDHLQVTMRVRQKHVITVVMDTSYDVNFGRLDARHGYSISRSTRIAEIDAPGTRNERELSAQEEHGFLWRMNTYWSYEERDGGLYMQIESVTLTRAIPRGLGWLIGPFVESVPRESLEFTLRSTCNALRK
jgi:hypothetical protein